MGMDCEEHPDGSQTCRRYKRKKGELFATGSEVDLIPDPQTCKVRVVGRVNDEDRQSIQEKVKEMESQCKRGF